MRTMRDTSDARWLRDRMGGTEQLGERASPIPPNLTGHGHTAIDMPSTSCTLGIGQMGLIARSGTDGTHSLKQSHYKKGPLW